MKTALRLTIATSGLAAFNLSAQTAASPDIQTYAVLTITGTVGTVYSVECVTDLAQTNDPAAWRCLEYLQLPVSPYLWVDKQAPTMGKRFSRAVAMQAPYNMVFIPPGTFRMGSPTNEVDRWDNEGPQTAVTISRGFWMGKYEMMQGEYLLVKGNNPSYFQPPNATADTNRPVEQVSWYDATAYCAALTQRERLAGRISTNSVYRLPTEAEWEYACRGWTSTRFSYGDDPGYTILTIYAWYEDNSGGTTHPAGQKLPNPWGLYDMHGNVLEWCQDWLSDYAGGIALDPQGPRPRSSQTWRSFLNNHLSEIAAMDFFVVPTATLRVLYVRVVLAHERRKVVHFNVTESPRAAWTAQQIVNAFPETTAPRFLLRDRVGICGAEVAHRIQGLGIEEKLIPPRSPWQNPFAERLIGSIGRECLDHVIILNEHHLRKVLRVSLATITNIAPTGLSITTLP